MVYGAWPGASGPPPVLQDLGDVSLAVATVGARALSEIPVGGSVAYRLVLSLEGDYLLWCRYTGDGVSLSYSEPDGATEIVPVKPGVTNDFQLHLDAGEYILTAKAYGDSAVSVDWELLSANGVGQNPAIAPRLVNPPSIESTASGSILVPISPAAPGAVSIGHDPSPAPSPGPSSTRISVGLIYDRPPVGRPTLDVDHVAVVGPTSPGGSHSLAVHSAGLPEGLIREPIPTTPPGDWSTASAIGTIIDAQDGLRSEADGEAVAAERVLSLVASWYPAPSQEAPEAVPDGRLEASAMPASVGPLWPRAADGEGTSSDPYATWMLPFGAMVANSWLLLRGRNEVRPRALPRRSWRPRSYPKGCSLAGQSI